MAYHVYLLASRPGGALYLGSTNNLARRLEAHRAGLHGHTARYNIKTLVWLEEHPTFASAFERERRMKTWRRAWKIALITELNPGWRDLSGSLA